MIPRTVLLAGMVVGMALANGCGRAEMETLVHMTGNGGANPSTGGAGGSAAGPCGEATCLTSLFQTCVPEGSCSLQGGASPSASFNTGCYANGVTVSDMASYNGTNVTGNLTVRRNGALCYTTVSNSRLVYLAKKLTVGGTRSRLAASRATTCDQCCDQQASLAALPIPP